jgi:uncharacterized protein
MKRVGIIATLILALPFALFAYTSPGKPQGFVNDFAKILSADSVSSINQTLNNLNSNSGIQIAVVTVPSLGDETIETYAVKLFQECGIGNKDKDNGVLFLIAPTEKQVRIEVGYGLEGTLTDAQSNGIIQNIVLPEFKNGNYDAGIVKGTQAIIGVVNQQENYSGIDQSNAPYASMVSIRNIFLIFIFIVSILGRTKSWWYRSKNLGRKLRDHSRYPGEAR